MVEHPPHPDTRFDAAFARLGLSDSDIREIAREAVRSLRPFRMLKGRRAVGF